MPNYNPNINSGETRRRVWRVIIENPVNKNPTIRFLEEEVVKLSDGTEKSISIERDIQAEYSPGKVVPLKNPTDDSVIGQNTTHDLIMMHVYSLGRELQRIEDEKTNQ